MRHLLEKRIVLVTGKGGVGRTTLTAALAHMAAAAGKRVLVTEIGEPEGDFSPLARLFGRDHLPSTPETITGGISGSLLWAREGQIRFLQSVLPSAFPVRTVVSSKALTSFLEAAPSFHEMGVFYHLLELLRARDRGGRITHELILIDMPATGHTMALTGLPDILLKLIPGGAMADALREGQSYLYDPARSAACVVTLPETLPVTECLELIEGLRRTRVPVGSVVLNRYPTDPFDTSERDALHGLLEDEHLFGVASWHGIEGSRRARKRLEEKLGTIPLTVMGQATGGGETQLSTLVKQLESGGVP